MNHASESALAELNAVAYDILAGNLKVFGSSITPRHERALRAILGRMTALAAERDTGRWAYDLPCGGGKTQAIVAWCAAVERLALPLHCMVAASKVEALCDLKRELLTNGVAPERIGLMHSYAYEPEKAEAARHGEPAAKRFASEPATQGNGERPFLLVTHSRIRGADHAMSEWHFKGASRKLVVWDESLLVSEGRFITMRDYRRAVGFFGGDARASDASPETRRAHRFFEGICAALEAELEAQEEREPRPMPAPLHEAERAQIESVLPRVEAVDPLRDLLAMTGAPLRAVRCQEGGLITYDIVVPPDLANVVVLDASYPIRELATRDPSIRRDRAFDGQIKTYEEVTVHHMLAHSSRTAMDREFGRRRQARKLSRDVVEAIRQIPETEGVIVFTFKPRKGGPKFAELLRSDLIAAEVNLRTIVQDAQGRQRPRFVWLTWGQETSLSEFQYCTNVICVGTLHRSQADVASHLAGQTNDLMLRMTTRDLKRVIQTEMVHCLYQAMNRGSARLTKDGRAPKMNVWLLHPNTSIREPLSQVMPRVNWRDWKSSAGETTVAKTRQTADAIKVRLGTLVPMRPISARLLHLSVAPNVHRNTFGQALAIAVAESPGWGRAGRSVVPVRHSAP